MNKHFLLLGGPLSFLAYLVYLFSDLALFEHGYTFLALLTVLFACVYLRAHVYRYQMVALWVFALMSLINYLGWGLFGNAQDEFAAFVYARSGLATKHGIIPANCVGVIDSDYRGEILVTLTNIGKEPYTVAPFERIAQMILAPICLPELRQVAELDATERGAGGFGSTGK